jgi:hypothetical protein
MAEQQSSLRTALDSIMGWPAGGGTQTQGGTTEGGVVPRTTDVVNLGTTSTLENVVPEAVADPFAAQLAEIQAQNDALSASLAASATPAAPAAAPAVVPAAAPAPYVPSYTMPLQDYMNYIYDFNSKEWQAATGKGFSGKGPGDYGTGTMVDPKTGQSISSSGQKGATYLPADYNPKIAWVPPK